MPKHLPSFSRNLSKSHLIASLFATICLTLNLIVNAFVVGQFLGPFALSSFMLSIPVLAFILGLHLHINGGRSAVIAQAMADGRHKEANGHFTFAIMRCFFWGILLLLAGIFFSNTIAEFLCPRNASVLIPQVETYIRIILLNGTAFLILPGLCRFTRFDGSEKLSTTALIVANILNIFLAFIFVLYVPNIGSIAWANAISYLIGILIAFGHFYTKHSTLKLQSFSISFLFSKTARVGFSLATLFFLICIHVWSLNHIISEYLGIRSLSIYALCFNLISIVFIFSSLIIQSIQPLSMLLIGQGDFKGFYRIIKKTLFTLLGVSLLLSIILELAPYLAAYLFGLSSPRFIQEAIYPIRMFSLSILPFVIIQLLMHIYSLLHLKKLKYFIPFAQYLLILPIAWFLGSIRSEWVWISFFVSEVCLLVIIFIISLFIRYKSEIPLGFLFLLPKPKPKKMLRFFMSSEKKNFGKLLNKLEDFLAKQVLDDKYKRQIILCCEELLLNIFQQAYSDRKKHSINLYLTIYEDVIHLCITDNGKAFNPLKYKSRNMAGLTILNGICDEIQYRHLFNQNMLFLKILNKEN